MPITLRGALCYGAMQGEKVRISMRIVEGLPISPQDRRIAPYPGAPGEHIHGVSKALGWLGNFTNDYTEEQKEAYDELRASFYKLENTRDSFYVDKTRVLFVKFMRVLHEDSRYTEDVVFVVIQLRKSHVEIDLDADDASEGDKP